MTDPRWILLVEDEEDHRLLVAQALNRMGSDIPLLEVGSGEKALEWMRRQVASSGDLNRGLVILDLGLPGISGFGVLQEMREVPELKQTPVVVITASQNTMDQDHAFNLGVRGFFQKPADFRDYQDILGRVLALGSDPAEDHVAETRAPAGPLAGGLPPEMEKDPPAEGSEQAGPGDLSDRPMTFVRRPPDSTAGSE